MNYNLMGRSKINVQKNNIGSNFWILLFGKIISQLGDGVFNLALPWYILSMTDSVTAMSSYLVVSNITSGITVVLFGKYLDKWKHEKVLYITDFIRGIYILFLFSTILFGFSTGLIWVYLCAVVLNICSALFGPASMSMIPQIVNDHNLLKANSLLSLVDNGISLLGLAVGGIVYEFFGIKLVFLISGIAYVLSGVSEMFIHPKRVESTMDSQNNRQLKNGIKYLMNNRKILFIIIFALVWNYIYITVYAIYIPYIFNAVYKTTIGAVAIIEMTLLIGMLFGAYISTKYNINESIYRRLTQVVIFQFPVFLLLPFILWLNNVLLTSVVFIVISFAILFFILGITVSIVNVNVSVILQRETKDEFLGRVYSLKSLGSMISMAFGLIIGGIIIGNVNVFLAFAIQAVLFLLLCFTMVNRFYFGNKEGSRFAEKNEVE